MNLINSIEYFREKYNNTWTWFIRNQCSIEVLEYYIENYDNIRWFVIYNYQPLTESFIIKYKDKIDWDDIFHNVDINLTHEFIESNLYHFNLYKLYLHKADISKYTNIINILKDKYIEKYNIDKLSYELNKR